MAEADGLGASLYSPLAGGLLTGTYRGGEKGRLSVCGRPVEATARRTAVADAVLEIADKVASCAAQVSRLATRTGGTALHAAGPDRRAALPAHLEEYLCFLDLELDEHHHRLLDEVSAIDLGTPHDDVATALSRGFDGDRNLLEAPFIPVR